MERDVRYDIGQLFQLAFGTTLPVMVPYPIQVHRSDLPEYNIEDSELKPVETIFKGVETKTDPITRGRKSQYGKPLLFPTLFEAGKYKRFDRFGVLKDAPMEKFHLPASTMVDFTRSKILRETAQAAGEGPVVEMYGFESWTIRIRGLCLADPAHPTHKTAMEQKEALLKWEDLASGIYVTGSMFSEKNIYYMAIKTMSLNQLEGRPWVFPFEMDCISLVSPEDQIL
jgi:hypothetical protein